jgi:MYXO-CTERM domain-containing protein
MMRPAGIARLSLLTLAGAVAMAPPAHGYVRSRVDGGIPKYWQTSCIPLAVYLNTFSEMTRDEVAKSVGAAAHTWSPTEVTCPDGVSHPFIEIVPAMMPEGAVPPTPAYDGHNTLLFYTEQRPYPPPDVSGISGGVVALTSTWARADGHIVDADVRVNAVDNRFVNIDTGFVPANGDSVMDLQNALTHELGHLIGLGHSCWAPFSDFEQPIDDQGVGVPYCDGAPNDVKQTVMFAMIDGNLETTKRHLSPDDIRAVCEIYPPEQDPHACTLDMPNDGCGCNAGDGAAPAGAGVTLALLAGLGLAARSRTKCRSVKGPRTSGPRTSGGCLLKPEA